MSQESTHSPSSTLPQKRKTSTESTDGSLLPSLKKIHKINNKFNSIIQTERQPTLLDDNLTTKDLPLTQDDVAYFQKQAIYRLLHLQYNKNLSLLDSLNLMNNNYSKLVLYNSILIQWWFQILENLKSIFGVDPQSLELNSTINDDILLSLSSFDSNTTTNDNINKDSLVYNLNTLRDGLIKLLDSVFKNGNSTVPKSAETILDLENKLSNLNVKNDTLNNENSFLKSNISKLNNRIEDLTRSLDRSTSSSLNRIKDDTKTEVDEKVNGKQEHSPANGNNTTSSDPVIKSEKTLNGSASTNNIDTNFDPAKVNSQIEELNLMITSLEAKNETLQHQLDEKLQLSHDLEKKIVELNSQSKKSSIDNDDLLKDSPNYRRLVDENKKLSESLNDVSFNKKKLENQIFELESKFSLNKAKLESKFKAELESSNNYISKLENDINRIRSDRDSLNSKISILQKEKGKNELINNLNKLVETLQKRIDELEQLELKNLDTLSKDEHNKILVDELKQIEEAFKSTREISIAKLSKASESETLINKLSIEKAKADEKYFQAMRAKDSLSSQNKVLSSNLTKQMELIEIMKSNEEEVSQKLEVETKLYDTLSKVESMYQNDIVKLHSKISNLDKKLVEKSETENDLRSQISKYQFELQQLEKKLLSCQQDLASESKKIAHYKSQISAYKEGKETSPKLEASDLEIQEALLSMTKCSLCKKNFKNVSLKTCGHCFCKDCIDDRLAARMRKCPICNSQFSRYDLLTIHL